MQPINVYDSIDLLSDFLLIIDNPIGTFLMFLLAWFMAVLLAY